MSCKTLLLIPTVKELQILEDYFDDMASVEMRLCGFGLVEATINTYREVEISNPDMVVLVGVAGTYDEKICAVGQTYCFETVSQYGIGCQRDSFALPNSLGFDCTESITLQPLGDLPQVKRLVSVTSAGTFSSLQIHNEYTDAVVEDMEGFGYALGAVAAKISQISIVRSIANVVGQPFHEKTLIEALHHLGRKLRPNLEAIAN